MEYTIRPSDNGAYIILTVVGDFTAKSFMNVIVESHALGKRIGTRCYLVDVTQARNIDSSAGTYEFAYTDMKQTEGVDQMAKVAGLVSPGDHSHDFVETVSLNAGMSFKLFTEAQEAIAYLTRKASSG